MRTIPFIKFALLQLAYVFWIAVVLVGCSTNSAEQEQLFVVHNDIDNETYTIYVVDVNGDILQRVAELNSIEQDTSLSKLAMELAPNGQFVSWLDTDGSLYLIDVASGQIEKIADAIYAMGYLNPVKWSPDSQWLAYYGQGHEDTSPDQLFVYNLAHEEHIPLTQGLELGPIDFAWSYNSKYLAIPAYIEGALEYVVIDVPSGTQAWKSELGLNALSGSYKLCNVAWSPVEESFAFVVGCLGGESASRYAVYIADLENRSLMPIQGLLPNSPRESILARIEPYWSPDGNTLLMVYAHGRPPYLAEAGQRVYEERGVAWISTADIAHKNVQILQDVPTTFAAWHEYVAWSANRLLWNSGDRWIYLRESETHFTQDSEMRFEIPSGCWPVWAPNGTFFAFSQSNMTASCAYLGHIYVINIETGEARNVTEQLGGANLLLGWTP